MYSGFKVFTAIFLGSRVGSRAVQANLHFAIHCYCALVTVGCSAEFGNMRAGFGKWDATMLKAVMDVIYPWSSKKGGIQWKKVCRNTSTGRPLSEDVWANQWTTGCQMMNLGCNVLLTIGWFLLTVECFAYSCVWELFCLQWELSTYNWSFVTCIGSCSAQNGKVHRVST